MYERLYTTKSLMFIIKNITVLSLRHRKLYYDKNRRPQFSKLKGHPLVSQSKWYCQILDDV